MIRDGFYCGRKMQAAHFHAVWFMEEDQLKVYERTGDVVAVFSGTEIGDIELLRQAEPQDDLRTPSTSVVSISTPVDPHASESESLAQEVDSTEEATDDSIKKAA